MGERHLRGITKPWPVSPAVQALVGVPEIPRTKALKLIWAYIKQHDLQTNSVYKCRDRPFIAYNSIAFLCGSTVATGRYAMSSQASTVLSSSSSSPWEGGDGPTETGRPNTDDVSPIPSLGHPTVGGSASESGQSSGGKRRRSPQPSSSSRKQAGASGSKKKSDEIAAAALTDIAETGKQMLQLVKEMYQEQRACRNAIPSITTCMARVTDLVGDATPGALAAVEALQVERTRELFMAMSDSLARMWIDRQVHVQLGMCRPNFPPP